MIDAIFHPPGSHERLESLALCEALAMERRGEFFGLSDESFFLRAFKQAQSKLAGHRAVGLRAVANPKLLGPQAPPPAEFIYVSKMEQQTDGSWKPVVNQYTLKPEMTRVTVEHDAYAPNLPADHPINLRFRPLDGPGIEERLAQHKSEREQAQLQRELPPHILARQEAVDRGEVMCR